MRNNYVGFDPEAELEMLFPDGIDDGVSIDTILRG